jgi:hypothetical protein
MQVRYQLLSQPLQFSVFVRQWLTRVKQHLTCYETLRLKANGQLLCLGNIARTQRRTHLSLLFNPGTHQPWTAVDPEEIQSAVHLPGFDAAEF